MTFNFRGTRDRVIDRLQTLRRAIQAFQQGIERDAHLRKKFEETSRKVLRASIVRTKKEPSEREYFLERAINLLEYANHISGKEKTGNDILSGQSGSLGRFFEAAANYFEAAGETQSAMSCLAFAEQNYRKEGATLKENANIVRIEGDPRFERIAVRAEIDAIKYENMAKRTARRIEMIGKGIERE